MCMHTSRAMRSCFALYSILSVHVLGAAIMSVAASPARPACVHACLQVREWSVAHAEVSNKVTQSIAALRNPV